MKMIPKNMILHNGNPVDAPPTELYSVIEISSADLNLWNRLCELGYWATRWEHGGAITMELFNYPVNRLAHPMI
jgi:hypothetical protein